MAKGAAIFGKIGTPSSLHVCIFCEGTGKVPLNGPKAAAAAAYVKALDEALKKEEAQKSYEETRRKNILKRFTAAFEPSELDVIREYVNK